MIHEHGFVSSAIQSIIYNTETRELGVSFTDGRFVEYKNVPMKTYEEFKKASSAGAFFNKSVRDSYPKGG